MCEKADGEYEVQCADQKPVVGLDSGGEDGEYREQPEEAVGNRTASWPVVGECHARIPRRAAHGQRYPISPEEHQEDRGERQRAALAVGMAASPGLLLVDEPTSQLDTAGRDEVLDVLERVNAERGTTIVVVTHDAEVGSRMGRVVTIRDGRVGAEGRSSLEFAVVAGDGTVRLPPAVLGDFPPGTLFAVDHAGDTVTLVADRAKTS